MSTSLAKSAAADFGRLANLPEAAAHEAARSPRGGQGGDPYLRMGKDGIWVYGPDSIEVQEGSVWEINPLSYERGYTCWTDYPKERKKKNERLGTVRTPIDTPAPPEDDLPTYLDPETGEEWPWQESKAVKLVCVSGEDQGTVVLYDTSSNGGLDCLGAYVDLMQIKSREGASFARVTFGNSFYDHPQYGKIYKPEFNYEDWVKLEESIWPAVLDGSYDPANSVAASVEDKSADDKPKGKTRRRPAA